MPEATSSPLPLPRPPILRPYALPAINSAVSHAEIAAILSYTRTSWGNAAAPVPTVEVQRARSGPLW